jgi:hypothetical protein
MSVIQAPPDTYDITSRIRHTNGMTEPTQLGRSHNWADFGHRSLAANRRTDCRRADLKLYKRWWAHGKC